MTMKNSAKSKLLSTCIWFTLSIWSWSFAQESSLPSDGHHYPVHIGAEDHVVQGQISANAEGGQLVPYNSVIEGQTDTNFRLHLRVKVRDSVYKRPYLRDVLINNSDPKNPQMQHPVEAFDNGSLPYGMQFAVIHTDLFYVNEDGYIAVKDLSGLRGETRIYFDVILKDKLAETQYVSNYLPFVVDIQYPKTEQNPDSLLFAGVLVLAIVVISLIIPFAVRAQRRCKSGKPIFGCGSADDTFERESLDYVPDYLKNGANSVRGKDNLAMMLENGQLKEHRSSIGPHSTIQKRMLMSTSNIKFQPRWMDPHYNDVYNRPDFSTVNPKHSPKNLFPGIHSKKASISKMVSTSSSSSRSNDSNGSRYSKKANSDKANSNLEKLQSMNGVRANCDTTLTMKSGDVATTGGVFTVTNGQY